MNEYPIYLTQDMVPYDPLELTEKTLKSVQRGNMRKYTKFYCVGVYGGISTGYTVGCCLKCSFCWVDWSRDFPQNYGEFFSPKQVFQRLIYSAKKRKIPRMRISGGEPTLSKSHLLSVLDLVNTTNYHFILETNGILLGHDKEYAFLLRKYKNVHIRVCVKAGTKEGFQKRTGAIGDFYELPYSGIRNLLEAEVEFHVACMSDPRLMSMEERKNMLLKLEKVGYYGYLEEEFCDPYPTALIRLEKAGCQLFDRKDQMS